MTVKALAEKYLFNVISMPCPDREINGGYSGDLLSWVMGRATAGNVWITIMTNINIAAVASLADISAVIIAEGASPDPSVVETAKAKGINILSTDKNVFETSVMISDDV